MLNIVIKASKEFIKHQLQRDSQLTDKIFQDIMYISYIDMHSDLNYQKLRVYISLDTKLTQEIANIFLFEEESDEQTLKDMALETTNMIVGSAKVLAEEQYNSIFHISTPIFIKKDTFDLNIQNIKNIQMDSFNMLIAIEEL